MSDRQLEFSIKPHRLEESNAVNQLCCESLRVLGENKYNSRQIEALVSRYSTERSDEQIDMMNNIVTLLEAISLKNLDKPNTIVAHIGERIIGYGCILSANWLSNDSLLAELFVHPEYARQGVGTKLLQTLESNVMDNSKVIKICATLVGEPFYRANGYRTVERYSSFIDGVRIPFVSMEKWLTPPSEMEKFLWDTSQQSMRNIDWLVTETEGLLRETFDRQ